MRLSVCPHSQSHFLIYFHKKWHGGKKPEKWERVCWCEYRTNRPRAIMAQKLSQRGVNRHFPAKLARMWIWSVSVTPDQIVTPSNFQDQNHFPGGVGTVNVAIHIPVSLSISIWLTIVLHHPTLHNSHIYRLILITFTGCLTDQQLWFLGDILTTFVTVTTLSIDI